MLPSIRPGPAGAAGAGEAAAGSEGAAEPPAAVAEAAGAAASGAVSADPGRATAGADPGPGEAGGVVVPALQNRNAPMAATAIAPATPAIRPAPMRRIVAGILRARPRVLRRPG